MDVTQALAFVESVLEDLSKAGLGVIREPFEAADEVKAEYQGRDDRLPYEKWQVVAVCWSNDEQKKLAEAAYRGFADRGITFDSCWMTNSAQWELDFQFRVDLKTFNYFDLRQMYLETHSSVREDIVFAIEWAQARLAEVGRGDAAIQIEGLMDGMVYAVISAPDMPADFEGRSMETGSEAIVMAVCEFIRDA